MPEFCDVALPIPVDQAFTYSIPQHLTVQPGCRVVVSYSSRRLTGVVTRTHSQAPQQAAKPIAQVIDETPVLDAPLLKLAHWIAEYYCSPLGEVLRAMLPLSGELRRAIRYELTDAGHDAARALSNASGAAAALLQLLEQRPRPLSALVKATPEAKSLLREFTSRRWVQVQDETREKDPLRASAERLEIEFLARPNEGVKLNKRERELLAYLELHPGPHNLASLEDAVAKGSEAGRALARKSLVSLGFEGLKKSALIAAPTRTLNEYQQKALDSIDAALGRPQFHTFLLEGVTGSGKTEVYMHAIDAALRREKSALLLVPEIALTPAVAGQFLHRFGDQVAILHSAIGDADRAEQWRRIQSGNARVVIGTRSGVFAPVQNLGLIIIDEEHDASYKQGETPRYHGRDVAVVRAREIGAVVVLGSATPSIETRFNAEAGKYTLLRLPYRVHRRPMPQVEIVDMRIEFLETKKQSTFSRKLLEEIGNRLQRREQVMLLLNRRGFSSFVLCRACGERVQCINCAVALTYHKRDQRMLCHYCGYVEPVPAECPKCGNDHIQFIGSGSQRVEEELHLHFPEIRVARLDRDTAARKDAFQHILQTFREGAVDVLVGTQMIAKGHDIPNVTLVGVVLADIGLGMPDFRAGERTFQLLTQAAGRAGRGDLPGQVVIQTVNPEHYAISFAAAQDYQAFYTKEIEFRKWLRYPPFAAFANLIVRDPDQDRALQMATELGRLLQPPEPGVRVMGPAEAPVPRLLAEFRYQILIKANRRALIRSLVAKLREHGASQKWRAGAFIIDVDPITLM